MSKKVILVNRDSDSLTNSERRELRDNFGADAELIRTDPRNEEEHLADCERIQPDGVILLPEPFWILAKQAGFKHGAFTCGRQSSTVLRLVHTGKYDFGLSVMSFKPWPVPSGFPAYYDRPGRR